MPILSPNSQTLPNIACFIGTVPLFIGINGLLNPSALLAAVEFPAPITPEAQELAFALTRIYSARNVVIGSICTAIWYRGDRKLLGSAMVIASFSALVDGLVSLKLIGGGLWYHFPVVPVAIAVGAGLLGWLG